MTKQIVTDKTLGHQWRYYLTHIDFPESPIMTFFYLCDKCNSQGYAIDKAKEPMPIPINRKKIKCEEIKFEDILA